MSKIKNNIHIIKGLKNLTKRKYIIPRFKGIEMYLSRKKLIEHSIVLMTFQCHPLHLY